MNNTSYITIVENTPSNAPHYNRPDYKVVINLNWMWHFARFYNIEQLERFCSFSGLTYELQEEKESQENGKFQLFKVNQNLKNDSFTSLDQIPEGAKPLKALSNGSLVDCYLFNDGENITIYRPNPNCKDIYKPMAIEDHITHQKENGTI